MPPQVLPRLVPLRLWVSLSPSPAYPRLSCRPCLSARWLPTLARCHRIAFADGTFPETPLLPVHSGARCTSPTSATSAEVGRGGDGRVVAAASDRNRRLRDALPTRATPPRGLDPAGSPWPMALHPSPAPEHKLSLTRLGSWCLLSGRWMRLSRDTRSAYPGVGQVVAIVPWEHTVQPRTAKRDAMRPPVPGSARRPQGPQSTSAA